MHVADSTHGSGNDVGGFRAEQEEIVSERGAPHLVNKVRISYTALYSYRYIYQVYICTRLLCTYMGIMGKNIVYAQYIR